MNSEYKIQVRAFAKLLWVCVFALLYAFGGIEFKWIRRFIAPVWLGVGMYLFSKDWRVFLQTLLMFGSLSLGYGASALSEKIIKRAIFGFANGFTAITHLFDKNFNKKRFWTLFVLNIVLCVIMIVTLGVVNPVNARSEELLIGFVIGLLSMYIPERQP